MTPMTYEAAIQFLYSLRLFGTKLGLENTFKLAAAAGNPQDHLRFIHVAGTNGKGSTCAMLESIYRAAGLRVGLFTSPHLVSFGERIQVNRQPISQADVVRLVSDVQALLDGFPAEAHPTFFEVITIMALRYFVEQRCELVIWETGLGGRLDATNIVTPLASVITTIALDHEKWLGDTLDKIAGEKAGIIKQGVPVVTSATPGHGLERIIEVAHQHHAPLTVATATLPPMDDIRLPLAGEFQRVNAAVAVATVRALEKVFPLTEKTIVDGLSGVRWPGRMQLVERGAGRFFLLDGAHNPAGAEALRHELQKQFPDVKPTIILGILADKDWKTIGTVLAPVAGRLVLTRVNTERTLEPEQMLALCREANAKAPASIAPSLAAALKETEEDRVVVITGSLYLVGEAIELLGLSPAPATEERGLNDWGRSLVR